MTVPPLRLLENRQISFIGTSLMGDGFVLDQDEALAVLRESPAEAAVIKPYTNGKDLNSTPLCSSTRWVVDFRERSLDEARRFTRAFEIVRDRVLPYRQTKDAAKYPRMVNEWWKPWNSRPGMYGAIESLDDVLAIAVVSKVVLPTRVPADQTFSNQVVVFATDSYQTEAVLSSSLHQLWAITFGSTLETRVRYTPTDVFETFPRPTADGRFGEIGRVLDDERREIMVRRQFGMTALYNLVNDPAVLGDSDVGRLRRIHVKVDEVAMAAYGWEDISLNHGFYTYRQMERFTVSPAARVEILDRLLALNHQRARAEGQDVPDQGELL